MPTYDSSSCMASKNCRVWWYIACYISCIKVCGCPQKTIAWFSFVRMKGDETLAMLLLGHQPQATRSLNKFWCFFFHQQSFGGSFKIHQTRWGKTNAFLGWITDINIFLFIFLPSTASSCNFSHSTNPILWRKSSPHFFLGWVLKKTKSKKSPKKTGETMVIRFLEITNSATNNGSSTKSRNYLMDNLILMGRDLPPKSVGLEIQKFRWICMA